MAKKSIDSEALKKHQFWIGLGAFALLWLIAVVVVAMAGDPAPKKTWEEAKKKIETYSKGNVKTPAYQDPWKSHQKMFSDHKDTVWGQAWEQQKDMYQWPKMAPRPNGTPFVPLHPDDSWGEDELNRRSAFRDQYKTQFTNIESVVAPVEIAGGIDAIIPQQLWSTLRAPSREEIWLSQEDFWVRREMLYIVADALRTVAFFKPVKLTAEDEKLPAGIVRRYKFRNPNWEMDLHFEQSKENNRFALAASSSIKNINVTERTQPLANPRTQAGLVFRLWQGSAQFTLVVEGEPVQHNQVAPIKLKNPDIAPISPLKTFGLEQVLEWELSPVRKIEGFYLAHHSHRTTTTELKIRNDLKLLDPDASEKEGGTTAPGGSTASMTGGSPPGVSAPPGGAPRGGPPGPDMGMGGPPGGAVSGELTPYNKINRTRYLHVKDQARHLPIAMKLVVDQAHIHDVLTAFATSRLRIQTTQVTLHHVTNVQRTTPKDGKGGAPGAPPGSYSPPDGIAGPPGAGSGYQTGMRPPRGMGGPPPGSVTGMGEPGMGGGDSPRGDPKGFGESSAIVQDTARLVELSIYGIATLYERPRVKKEETPPGTTTQPK